MSQQRTSGSIFLGAVIIILGIGFLLDNLNVINFGWYMQRLWPLFIIGAGLTNILNSRSNPLGGIITITIGALLLLNSFGILGWQIWALLWPIILIVVGVQIIFFKKLGNHESANNEDVVKNSVVFSGSRVKNGSKTFKGGEVNAVFGGLELDLRESDIAEGETVILAASAIFGGIDMQVPQDWRIIHTGLPLFGGIEDKTFSPSTSTKILQISSSVMFGGISIKN